MRNERREHFTNSAHIFIPESCGRTIARPQSLGNSPHSLPRLKTAKQQQKPKARPSLPCSLISHAFQSSVSNIVTVGIRLVLHSSPTSELMLPAPHAVLSALSMLCSTCYSPLPSTPGLYEQNFKREDWVWSQSRPLRRPTVYLDHDQY